MSQKRCFYFHTCGNLVGNSEHALCLADTTEQFPMCNECYKKLNIVNTFNMSIGALIFLILYILSMFQPREFLKPEGNENLIYSIFVLIPLFVTCLCRMICRTHTSSPISTND